jgi:hypothetical protein
MQLDRPSDLWNVTGASVRGATHIRNGLPNQDCIDWAPKSQGRPPLVLAVSDGHGNAKSFRSDRGAQFGVEVALEALTEFFRAKRGHAPPSDTRFSSTSVLRDSAQDKLPRELVRRWTEKVERDIQQHQFSPEKLESLSSAKEEVLRNPLLAYGATLLVVLIGDSYILYVQLGDGDILTVSQTGAVSRPVAGDSRLFANETTSLCAREAWRDFRITVQQTGEFTPALILLSSDGYANSFRDDSSFEKVGSDIFNLIQQEGWEKVKTSIEGWLSEASEKGSGDDISLGLLWRAGKEEADKTVREQGTVRMNREAQSVPAASGGEQRQASAQKKLLLFRDKYGEDALKSEQRLNAVLLDLFDPGQREVLRAVHQTDVIAILRRTGHGDLEMRMKQLAKHLARTKRLNWETARWAVEVWAAALGLIPISRPAAVPHDLSMPIAHRHIRWPIRIKFTP